MREEQLREADLMMVWHCIHKNGFEISEDIFQIGCMGLIKACRKFDVSKGFSFSTYAYMCITNEIKMSFRKKRIDYLLLSDEEWEYSAPLYDLTGTGSNVEVLDVLKQAISQTGLSKPNQEILLDYFIRRADGEDINYSYLVQKLNHGYSYISKLIKKIRSRFVFIYFI